MQLAISCVLESFFSPCVIQPRAPKYLPKKVDLKTGSQQLLQWSSFLAGLPDSMETGDNAILEIMRSNTEKYLGTLKRIVVSEVRSVVLFPNCMLELRTEIEKHNFFVASISRDRHTGYFMA